ncbi:MULTISPECIES: hypothetical protein [Citrobacter]|uniref:hypothetical protein n=1 Tax=Citrobacter TaxID=544 RepID=UPI0011593654|nr:MULTISPECIES: hypothetical protein [Citrobacter]EIP1106878.1 hypothetical protein [Citrobacter freundii]ELR9576980.1 hypothetical protein [Citrobacter freundii]MBJ8931744.1 hypothetical protein [Citrobacter freundii]MBW9592918.1 hypothetical protein [Citrobacter freundii]MDH0387869.1 hypothetical protein [Citrobacter freundii]
MRHSLLLLTPGLRLPFLVWFCLMREAISRESGMMAVALIVDVRCYQCRETRHEILPVQYHLTLPGKIAVLGLG